jgi:hypothetical protein
VCTNFQSPSTIVGTLTASAQQTNADGRVIMSAASMTVTAGVIPDFGSKQAFVTSTPAETGSPASVTITVAPAVSGVQYNWNFEAPSLWTVPSAATVGTCTATYLTSQFQLPYSRAGQNIRFETSLMPMSVTTLDAVTITCTNFTTPYINTAASTHPLTFLTDTWTSPSTNPASPSIAWPAIVPGVTPYKTVTLLKPQVNTVTDATFHFQLEHTKLYELQGVLTLTW